MSGSIPADGETGWGAEFRDWLLTSHDASGNTVDASKVVSVTAYGATGDGVTDDTTAIQAAIDQAITVNGCCYLPVGTYKISSPLVIDGGCTIKGESFGIHWGTAVAMGGQAGYMPLASPFFQGAIINMITAGTDAIQIAAVGESVNVHDLGVVMGTESGSVMFQNTGHGFSVLPPVSGTFLDTGIWSSHWSNVAVYGHDGDHYGFSFTNLEHCLMELLSSFGGGGINHDSNYRGYSGPACGNSVWVRPYVTVVAPGAAHGVHIGATYTVQLDQWVRPQVWMFKPSTTVAGISVTGPTTSQYAWKGTHAQMSTIDSPDWESGVGGTLVDLGKDYLDGFWYVGPNISFTGTTNVFGGYVNARLTTDGIIGSLNLPGSLSGHSAKAISTFTAGAALGTSPPSFVLNDTTVMRGYVQFGSGTSPTTGTMMTGAIPAGYAGAGNAMVVVAPTNAATAALGLYVSVTGTSSFAIGCATAPAASQSNTTYGLVYQLMT